MKATEAKFLEFLKKSPQFVIPIYQRTYSWTERECQQLWDDILRTGRDDKVSAHFVGSIVYVEKGLYQVSSQSPLLVIDGQQRLTTVTLLIEALARSLGDKELLDGFSAKKLRNYYLLNALEEGDRKYKLILSQTDKASLIALLDQQPRPKEHSIRVEAAFEFFKERLAEATAAPRITVSSVARELIQAGKTNEETFQALHEQFGLGDEKKSYPNWYRSDLRRKGLLSDAAKALEAKPAALSAPAPAAELIRDDSFLFELDELEAICKGLAKLVIVDISLNRDQDNPQLIFESLNSTGRELSQADLIRNFILMGLEPELQTRLYEQYWRPMEVSFGQEAYANYFDSFMRHYLTVKTGEIPNVREVYEAFKQYARSLTSGVEPLVADIRDVAGYFCSIALGCESDPELKAVFHDIRELKVEVAYPFLLELYCDYAHQKLSKEDFLESARLVESYVFRRSVCGIPTNSMNKTFATFMRSVKRDRYLESIVATFLLLPSYRRFPRDDEFKRDLQAKDLYNFRNRSYWLRRLENLNRKEFVLVDEYTIEHILPQNENLSAQWKKDLGPEWERIQKTYLHTLGNLTLTGYNSEYSDRPFSEKRDMQGGFRESPLRLNKGLGNLEKWTEETILQRAARLSEQAADVWTAPALDPDILASYRPTFVQAKYSIDDHPYLKSGQVKGLFEGFRKAVLALDPCVTEEFLKLYVAYKAETNFVDVVPQAKRLILSLNIKFHEVEDPKGMCKDVSGLGRWGNGDVEVILSSISDLQYVIGLVRQSLEKQMGNGEGS